MKDENGNDNDNENKNILINETYRLIEKKTNNKMNKSLLKSNLFKNNNYLKLIVKIFNLILLLILINKLNTIYLNKYKYYLNNDFNSMKYYKYINVNNNFSLSKYFKNYYYSNDINIKLFFLNYSFSLKYNIVEVQYNFCFFNANNTIKKPSDLTYYNNFHIICYIRKLENGKYILSLASINLNKYFNCIEYININEKIEFGIIIYNKADELVDYYENKTIYFFNDKIINYNKIYFQKEYKFKPFLLDKKYISLITQPFNQTFENNKTKKLINSFIQNPIFNTKYNTKINEDNWNFTNIYNNYFCFCKGLNCSYKQINQICKYKFYLYLIDNNRYIYNKTNYLLADFLGTFQSADDAYPIFLELIKQNKKAYYMTRRKDIYKKYCYNNTKCEIIINTIYINGNFLEKYFDLFLRLKVVIAGSEFYSLDNIFYNIEYITFICLTHGINYFKPFLYEDYYSYKKYDKIVTSTSNKIISLTKKYGWEDENIVKICFPKWDKYDYYQKMLNLEFKSNIQKSIFFFFTWRNWKNITNKANISSYYFKNIFMLMNNKLIKKEINKKNITLFFSLHHMFERYRKNLNVMKNIQFVYQNKISECLMKSNLIITDFSSVIFDIIYQRKPYIMFIPDGDDPNINLLYDLDYCNIINSLKNGTIYFENKFYKINQVINKIIYYINNDFMIEDYLIKFYDSFEFKCGNNTNKFIKYVENL